MRGDSRHGWGGGLCTIHLRTYFLLLVVLGAFKVSNSSPQGDCKLWWAGPCLMLPLCFPQHLTKWCFMVSLQQVLTEPTHIMAKGEASLCLNGFRYFSCTLNFLPLPVIEVLKNQSVRGQHTPWITQMALGNKGHSCTWTSVLRSFSLIRPDGEMNDSKLQDVEIELRLGS